MCLRSRAPIAIAGSVSAASRLAVPSDVAMATSQSIGYGVVVAASLCRGAGAALPFGTATPAVATMDCLFKANGESGEHGSERVTKDDTLMK